MNALLFVAACFILLSLIGSFSVYWCGVPKGENDFPWMACMNIFNIISCLVVIAAAFYLYKADVPVPRTRMMA
jgi:hypothetical protein